MRSRALGQAYMEEDEFSKAIETYQRAVALAPKSASDIINLGIAYYHGDHNEKAIETLNQALKMDSDNVFGHYTLGLAHKKIGDSSQALKHFKKVVQYDDTDAATTYNLGLALSKTGQEKEAVPWFEKTIKIDPKHSSSYYQLMMYHIRHQDREKARELQKKFRELKSQEEQKPPDAVDEGKFLGPIEFEIPRKDLPNFTSDLMVEMVPSQQWEDSLTKNLMTQKGRILAAIPNLQQHLTYLVIATADSTMIVTLSEEGEIRQKKTISESTSWKGCAPGNYDNDEDMDLLLFNDTETKLMQNEGNWDFKEVIGIEGLNDEGASDAVWADFDHEGDLDLILARAKAKKSIFRNDGNGGFENISTQIKGVDFSGFVSIDVSDFDNDNDLDFIGIKQNGNIEIFSNLRENQFKKVCSKNLSWKMDSMQDVRVQCADLNNDKRMDFTIIGANVGSTLAWKINKDWSIKPFDVFKYQGLSAMSIRAVFDANNDGYEDFMVNANGMAVLLLNQSPSTLKINEMSISILELEKAVPADLDFDGDLDLIAASYAEDFILLENQGGNKNHWLAVEIKGKKNTMDGYGSKILLKDGLFRCKKEVSSPVTHLGLGDREQLDVLRMTWPNGIFQNVIKASAGQILSVSEKPGYVGSCLFVYSWNGEKFEFVADSLCTGPLGLYVGGGYFPPDPDEYIRIRKDQLVSKDEELEIRLREELREIVYLDKARLISVKHPSGMEVYANERFTTPPFPEFKLVGVSEQAQPCREVMDNHGNDVTELLQKNDNRYPRPFGPSRLTGVGEEYWFEIDLNDFKDADTVYLFMTGYVDWPSSSEAYALEQNSALDFTMPYLQVKDESGEWKTVRDPMGFPAGKLKTVPLDISDVFLTNDRRVRIVSTLQVFWDRILVDTEPVINQFEIEEYALKSADLRYGGYSGEYQLAGRGPKWYDYSKRYSNNRWDYQTGLFTRYGDVLPLMREFDDKYVIMQHGDEVALRFSDLTDSDHPKTYFLHVTGWVKDLDYSTAFGQTVEPLPFKAMSGYPYGLDESYPFDEEHLSYLLEYNTRAIMNPNEPLRKPRELVEVGQE